MIDATPATGQTAATELSGDRPEEPLAVVVNARAGLDRRALAQRVSAALAEAGVPASVEAVEPQQMEERIRRMREGGAAMAGVGGGDGTMLTAASVLAGTATVLVPMPTGTLNHFARRLGLDNLPSAAAAALQRRSVSVPVGIVDDRVFLNTATFGLYADMVRRRERFRRLLRKWPAAGVAFVATLARLRVMDVTLVVDGERLERTTSLVWVGVGWGSFPFVHEAPERRAQPDLEIVILKPTGPMRSVALLLRLMFQVRRRDKPIRDRALEILHAQQLLIHSDRRIGVTLDGEVLRIDPPILVALQHDALRVISADAVD